MSDWEDGFAAGFHKAHGTPTAATQSRTSAQTRSKPRKTPVKKAKKMSTKGYHAKYGRAFKRLAPKFKKKDGGWKKNGFKRTAAAARKVAKK